MYDVACYCRRNRGPRPPVGWVAVAHLSRLDGHDQPYADPSCPSCGGTGLVPQDHVIHIDIHRGATEESWLVAYRDGTLVYHTENDGVRALNRGLEPHDRRITREELGALMERYPGCAAPVRKGLAAFYGPDFWATG